MWEAEQGLEWGHRGEDVSKVVKSMSYGVGQAWGRVSAGLLTAV